MFLLKLHDLIKHNYENGLYSKDYSYKAKDYSYKSDDFNSLSDFDIWCVPPKLKINFGGTRH